METVLQNVRSVLFLWAKTVFLSLITKNAWAAENVLKPVLKNLSQSGMQIQKVLLHCAQITATINRRLERTVLPAASNAECVPENVLSSALMFLAEFLKSTIQNVQVAANV